MKFAVKSIGAASLLAVLFFVMVAAGIAIPQKINYQGRLTDSAGDPVTGSKSIVFTIYDASAGGTNLWNETRTVPVLNGTYSLNLGDGTEIPASVFGGSERWLGIKVESDPEMVPRMKIVSVGNAYTAIAANYATLSGTSSREVVTSANITVSNGGNANVNIGTASYIRLIGPTAAYHVSGFTGDNVSGKVIWVNGVTAYACGISNEGVASTASNRISTNTGLLVTSTAAGGFMAGFIYDGTLSRWRMIYWNP